MSEEVCVRWLALACFRADRQAGMVIPSRGLSLLLKRKTLYELGR